MSNRLPNLLPTEARVAHKTGTGVQGATTTTPASSSRARRRCSSCRSTPSTCRSTCRMARPATTRPATRSRRWRRRATTSSPTRRRRPAWPARHRLNPYVPDSDRDVPYREGRAAARPPYHRVLARRLRLLTRPQPRPEPPTPSGASLPVALTGVERMTRSRLALALLLVASVTVGVWWVGTSDGARLFAVSPTDGRCAWSASLPAGTRVVGSPVVEGGRVVLTTAGAEPVRRRRSLASGRLRRVERRASSGTTSRHQKSAVGPRRSRWPWRRRT